MLLLTAIGVGIFAYPSTTKATVYDPNQLTLRLDSYMPNGNGSFSSKADNVLQVGKEIGSTQIQVSLTITAPTAGINFGTDTFDMNTADTEANAEKTGGLTITGMGAGLDKIGQGTNAGGADCTTSSIWVFSTKSNQQYVSCNFKSVGGPTNYSGLIQANQPQRANIDINFSDYGLDPNNVTTPQPIILYPFANFTRAGTNRQMAFPTGGFPIYVQFYNSQADANTAIASGSRPANVPGYAGSTSSGFSSNTGSSLLGFINELLVTVLGFVNEVIYFIFYWLIAPLVQAMLSIHTYQDQFVNVIYPGWELVRNICNIFFIIAIIAMAMATLFRVEGYQFRHLLVSLVIAALLVNFSLVIAQVILGFADTMQSQFLPNNVDVIRSLARDLMVANTRDAVFNVSLTNLGSFSYTVTFFFWVALAVGSFCVFAAIAVFLVIRIIALWILLMLSPVAYVAGILPATKSARQEWWGQFLKYAFFTPVMAFFLNMAAVISNNSRINNVLSQITDASFASSNAPAISSFVFQVASNVMLLVFLIVAIKVADSFGIYGASAITDIAQKGMLRSFQPWTWPGAKTLGDYKTRKSLDWTQPDAHGNVSFGKKVLFAAMNPVTTVKGYQHQSEEKRKTAKSVAEGRGFDIARQVMGGQPSEEGLEAQDHLVDDYKKHNPYRTTDQIVAHFDEIKHVRANQLQKEIAYEATIEQAAANKDMNDLLLSQGYSDDTEGYLKFLNDMVSSGKISEGRAARLAEKLSNSAFSNSEFWYGWGSKDGHIIKVDENGNVKGKKAYEDHPELHGLSGKELDKSLASLDAQTREGYKNYDMYGGRSGMLAQEFGKFKKKEPQDIARNAHHSAFRAHNSDGSVKGVTEVGADFIMGADDRIFQQADRANAEQVKALKEVIGRPDTVGKVADAFMREYASRNVKLDEGSARKMAAEQIQKFSTKYLRYDIETGITLPRDKTDPFETLVTKYDLKTEIRQIHKDQRDDVKRDLGDALSNPSVYKYEVSEAINRGTADVNIQTKIKDSALVQVTTTLSQGLSPSDMVANKILQPSSILVESEKLINDQKQIAKNMQAVIRQNPGSELKDIKDQLEQAVLNGLNSASTEEIKNLPAEAKQKIVNQILVKVKS